jgi:hypothetical protein
MSEWNGARDPEIEAEERAIYGILVVALSPVVIGTLVLGDLDFDGGTTLSLGCVVLGVLGLLGLVARARARRGRLPRARARRRRARRSSPAW